MELALQVVGLKMTGKIEDAKNVAMRIVGNAGSDNLNTQAGNSSDMMQMQLSSSSSLETRVINLLSVINTPLNDEPPLPAGKAISHTSPVGQTLLHLATFLGFASLVEFLIDHEIDIDARDRNGYTALHFAALVRSTDCARLLVDAGADREIVNSLGKTAQEIAPTNFFDGLVSTHTSEDSDEPGSSEDEEAEWGDGEEDAAEEKQMKDLKRRASLRALRRRSITASRKPTPKPSRPSSPPPPQIVPPTFEVFDLKRDTEKVKDVKQGDDEKRVLDEKQTASFMEKMIQRTFAQLSAPQLPDIPGMGAWSALPQIPMVFPVFVPMMPNWPSFLGGENTTGDKQDEPQQGLSTTAMRAAQEWRATWEKWVAMGVANTSRQGEQQAEELPPPVYTAKPTEGEQVPAASTSALEESKQSTRSRRASAVAEIRPVGYHHKSTLPEQVVEAFAYQPAGKQKQKSQKKGAPMKVKTALPLLTLPCTDDRMLMWFWVPILLLSAIWALLNGWRLAMKIIAPANASITAV